MNYGYLLVLLLSCSSIFAENKPSSQYAPIAGASAISALATATTALSLKKLYTALKDAQVNNSDQTLDSLALYSLSSAVSAYTARKALLYALHKAGYISENKLLAQVEHEEAPQAKQARLKKAAIWGALSSISAFIAHSTTKSLIKNFVHDGYQNINKSLLLIELLSSILAYKSGIYALEHAGMIKKESLEDGLYQEHNALIFVHD